MSYDPRDFYDGVTCEVCEEEFHIELTLPHGNGHVCTYCVDRYDHLVHATLCGHLIDTRKAIVAHVDGETSCLACAREGQLSLAA